MYQMAKYEPTLRREADLSSPSPPLGNVLSTTMSIAPLVGASSVTGTDRADGDFETSVDFEANGAMLASTAVVPMSKITKRPPCLSLAGLIITFVEEL
jgi:hypothetical protein